MVSLARSIGPPPSSRHSAHRSRSWVRRRSCRSIWSASRRAYPRRSSRCGAGDQLAVERVAGPYRKAAVEPVDGEQATPFQDGERVGRHQPGQLPHADRRRHGGDLQRLPFLRAGVLEPVGQQVGQAGGGRRVGPVELPFRSDPVQMRSADRPGRSRARTGARRRTGGSGARRPPARGARGGRTGRARHLRLVSGSGRAVPGRRRPPSAVRARAASAPSAWSPAPGSPGRWRGGWSPRRTCRPARRCRR